MKVIPYPNSNAHARRYPNGASRRYQLGKVLDSLLAGAITLSVVVIAVFLLTL